MKYPHFLAYCLRTPWAMDPDAMHTYAAILARAYAQRAGGVADDAEPLAREPKAARGEPVRAGNGAIGVIPVYGTIVQRASQLGMCEAGTGAQEVGAALDAAMADASIAQVLMDFDTPGGSVFGIQELGDKIRSMRNQKPIVGIANSMAASAGYWLLSQCSEAYVTPGGMVGSIGVYTAHQDVSRALDAEGVSVTLISAGKYKVEGNPFQPLDAEAQAQTQAQVDSYYRMFTQAVARGRGVPVEQVRGGMGEGRMLLADAALSANMVDGVATFDEVVAKMKKGGKKQRYAAMARAETDLATVAL